jgi:hypothetical protein
VKSPSSSTTLAKAYGIKVRCLYAEHVKEGIVNLGNILGTHYELRGNIVRTHWETRKNGKKILPAPQT